MLLPTEVIHEWISTDVKSSHTLVSYTICMRLTLIQMQNAHAGQMISWKA